ncbi:MULTISPECIES: TetR/AcrR family transcriptional regulator [Corallincola]|uniref:TetR/AcrR family transcriptional regulator n=1 Tax=Corallincola TaxID=1775176 RepID=UPI0013EE51FB|nr:MULTISPECIES: TetR/AcrR family transcriptional regulator [Corallincola]
MAVKGRSKSEQKRLQILDAAISLFTDLGYANTSMDKIAVLAGVSKQTVYSHFENKEQLFVAAVGQKCIAHELTDVAFNVERDLRETLLLVAIRFNELILSDAAVKTYRTCVAQAETHPQLGELFFQAGPKRVIAEVTNYLEKMCQRGALKIAHVPNAAVQLLLMAQSRDRICVELGLAPVQTDAERLQYLTSCVDLFIQGYSVNEA